MKQEQKDKISKGIKKYLKNNQDKHVWKNNDKFKSIPCEHFKSMLKSNNISFVEEYQPLEERYFSVDIAFPDKKIGIEINGNQHYNRDGSLKPYYQDRHDLIINNGWELFEYHYSVAYNTSTLQHIIKELKSTFNLNNVDYSFYIKQKKKNHCIDCGKNVSKTSKRCDACNGKSRKKQRSKEQIEQLIEEVTLSSFSAVGRKYGVSDTTIRKWLGKEGIIKYNNCKKVKKTSLDLCPICNKNMKKITSKTCSKNCAIIKSRKADYPETYILINDINKYGYSKVSKKLGVTPNAIKKYINNHNKKG